MTARCIDYPCCGHTDGLPCDWVAPDYTTVPHGLCDHENGDCDDDDSCWKCDGTGRFEYDETAPGTGPCDECDGTGKTCEPPVPEDTPIALEG